MKNLFVSVLLIIGISVTSCAEKETLFYITTSVIPEGAGVITPSSTEVLDGSNVSFKATPNGEYIFTGWSGSISGTTNPQKITVTSDMNVTANFALRSYPLTLSTEGEGQIIEKVISSRADYTSGTVVELLAQPSEHWQFSHWEGDLTGPENPAQITVSSAKSVKAVFTKKNYEYSLKIVGPGAVDEEIVETTRTTLEAGTIVRLSAHPDERTNAVFKGWSGDFTGTDPIIEVNVDDVKNITATFGKAPARKYQLPDLKQPSITLKKLYNGVDFSFAGTGGHYLLTTDYNRDGYVDCITLKGSPDGVQIHNIEFYLGQSDGSFIIDEKNHNRILGQIWSRKQICGDYNNDGLLDICLIGHGWDYEPWPGEYPIILMSSPSGVYKDVRLTQYVSFYHGGASADIDNDGDLDIILVDGGRGNEVLLINDGNGNFTNKTELINHNLLRAMYTAELYDIDHDGHCDFVVGLDDSAILENGDYSNMSIVFWGDGNNFNGSYTRLPKSTRKGMGLVVDYEFYDIDADGIDEILLSRTGDQVFGNNYNGYAIQVVKIIDREFKDITSQVFDGDDYYNLSANWIIWIDIEEIDGNKYLVGRTKANGEIYYELINGKFVKHASTSDFIKHKQGFVLYSDNVTMWDKYIDGAYTEDKFSGTTSMKFSGWKLWDGVCYNLNPYMINGTDLSHLKDNDYVLEYYIKNNDPTLIMDIKFESIINQNMATYCYSYSAENNYSEEWQRVTIPLKNFYGWDNIDDSYWSKIHHLHIQICNGGGKDFYLDEIRIRKAL